MFRCYIPVSRVWQMKRSELIDTIAQRLLEQNPDREVFLYPRFYRRVSHALVFVVTFFMDTQSLREIAVEAVRGSN